MRKQILQAVSLWVSGCRECRIDHLLEVSIGNDLYLRQNLHDWLTKELSERQADKAQPVDLEASLRDSLESTILLRAGPFLHEDAPRRKTFAAYQLEKRATFEHLCEVKPDREVTPLLWDVRQTLCSPAQIDKGLSASIRVRFRDGRTACGISTNIIACRADSELTEFNVRDYQFAFSEDSAEPLGHGQIEVNLLHVLMHEMGHWIGLQHINVGQSIMAGNLSQSRCIDLPTMLALDTLNSNSPTNIQAPPMAFTLTSQVTHEHSGHSRQTQRR